MAALAAAGVGIEAGLWQVEDVAALQASGFADGLTRVLVEPGEDEPAAAVATAEALDEALDAAGIAAPRVHHGFGWRRGTSCAGPRPSATAGASASRTRSSCPTGGRRLRRRAGQRGAGAVIARTTTLARSCAVATSSRQQPAFGTSMIDANDGARRWPP